MARRKARSIHSFSKRRAKPGEGLEFALETALKFEDREKCLEWPFAKTPDGYGRLKIGDTFRIVSRVVCEETYGPPSAPELQAAHSCGHPYCCNPWHLSWKTRVENEADKVIHGTHVRGWIKPRLGEENGCSKLTREKVLAIRASDQTGQELAARYGVMPSTIKSVRGRRIWAWL